MIDVKKLILLDFKGGFRVGRGDESDSTLSTIHSDTIYGAIVYWAFKLFGNDAEPFAKSLKCSSLIFKQDNDYIIPKPVIYDSLSLDDPKTIKSSAYAYLSKLSLKDPNRSVLTNSPVTINSIPRNALDRNTNGSMFYFIEAAYIKPDCLPCIILEFADSYEKMIISCLRALGDSGIGGDSTYGFGLFDFKIMDLPEQFNQPGKYYVLLSLCIPKEEEIEKLNTGYYKIIRKRGFRKDVVKAKVTLNYIAEGSTFTFPIQGRGVIKIEDYFIQTSPIVIAFGGDEK